MARHHRYLVNTPVRQSTRSAANHLRYVSIDEESIKRVAKEWVDDDFELPEWRAPVFPDERSSQTSTEDVIDFLFLGNCINFAFRDFETDEKFVAEFDGVDWEGAFGMWACLKRAYDVGMPILSGSYLSRLTESDVESIFDPANGRPIPMLEERLRILQSVGDTLVTHFDGHFHTLVERSTPKLFDDGNGIVDRLVRYFPSFDDTHKLSIEGTEKDIHIYKRAQLAPGMAYGRFHASDSFVLEDPEAFTVFADYNIPNILRHKGILEYEAHLRGFVDEGAILNRGSREEVELRVATILAADRLLQVLNKQRDSPVYGPHLDYKLFSVRDEVDTPVHKTKTIDY